MLCNSHHCLIRHLRRPIRFGSSDPSSLITIVTGPYATQRRSRLGTSIPFVWSLLFQALLGWTEQRTISEVGRGNFFFLISLYCHEMSREVISRLCFDIHPPLGCLINHNVHAKPSSHSSPPSFVVLPFFFFPFFFSCMHVLIQFLIQRSHYQAGATHKDQGTLQSHPLLMLYYLQEITLVAGGLTSWRTGSCSALIMCNPKHFLRNRGHQQNLQ